MSEIPSDYTSLEAEQACFRGLILATLSYGALVMIFLQLFSVLLTIPKRGRIFWGLITYASILLPIATVAIGTSLKLTEMAIIDNSNYPGGPLAWMVGSMTNKFNVIWVTCVTIFPWISDLLMFYRIMVLWNNQLWVLLIGGPLYLGRISMSVPYIIANIHPDNPRWLVPARSFGLAYSAISMTLNLFFTFTIAYRIWSLRRKVVTVLGGIPASHYVSFMTICTESAALFTIWTMIVLISEGQSYVGNDVFLKPYIFINAITRLLIALRMAENRMWTRDIVKAAQSGVLDWQVSSSTSITLPDPSGSTSSNPSISANKLKTFSAHHVQMQHLRLQKSRQQQQREQKDFEEDMASI